MLDVKIVLSWHGFLQHGSAHTHSWLPIDQWMAANSKDIGSECTNIPNHPHSNKRQWLPYIPNPLKMCCEASMNMTNSPLTSEIIGMSPSTPSLTPFVGHPPPNPWPLPTEKKDLCLRNVHVPVKIEKDWNKTQSVDVQTSLWYYKFTYSWKQNSSGM